MVSRKMPASDTETFRVIVTVHNEALNRSFEQSFGPFATKGAAKGAAKRETAAAQFGQRTVTATIERAELNWEAVTV